MTTFISYATPWDMHKGAISISDLSIPKQNELIRLTLNPEGDSRQFSINNNLIKTQVDGLWNLIVWIGLELEKHGVISNFDTRDDNCINVIVQFFDGTKLGERLKNALDLEHQDLEPNFYDWTELASIKMESLADLMDCSLAKTKAHLLKKLATATEDLDDAQPEIDLSPIQPSFIDRVGDIYYYLFNRKKYEFRVLDRKVIPYKMKYYAEVEQEIKVTVGDKVWPLFLDAQASDVNFMKAIFLLYEAGFIARSPPQNLVFHVVHGLRLYSTGSKSSGTLSLLTAIDKVKATRRK